MALQIVNRARVSVTSTGTGTMTLGSAVTGMADFSAVTSGSQVGYCIEDATGAWEVGQGIYTAGSPSTLTRATIESSSSAGAAITLTAGAQVYVTPTAGTYPLPATAVPVVNGTAAVGTAAGFARGDHVHPTDTSRAPTANPTLTGTVTIPDASSAASSTAAANINFVNNAVGGTTSILAAAGTYTLNVTEYGRPILNVLSSLTGNLIVVVPVKGVWALLNNSTGAFSVTVKTSTGTGVTVAQGYSAEIVADGTNVVFATTDFSSVAIPATAGLRNAIINGNFDIWQRGSSFTAAAGYIADRWTYARDGSGGVATVSRQAITETALLALGLTYWCNYACTTAGSGAASNQFIQKIENVRTFAGRTVTLSWWAKATTTVTVTPILAQYFGSGGSPTASVFVNGSAVSVTTTPQRYSQTFTLASIAAATRGTNGDDAVWLYFNLPLNATANISITGVQLEQSPVATAIERRPEQTELALCQRYYQTGSGTVGFYTTTVGTNWWTPQPFATVMRAAPTVLVTPSGGGSYSGVTGVSPSLSGFSLQAVSSVVGSGAYIYSFTANAEL